MKKLLIILTALFLFSCESEEKEPQKKEFVRETEQVLERYPNGAKKMEGELVNGERHGVWKFYFENGFVWSEGKYWYGKRRGPSTVFYKNGKVHMEGNYKNDLKVGTWKLYDENGDLSKAINMDELLTSADSLKLNEETP